MTRSHVRGRSGAIRQNYPQRMEDATGQARRDATHQGPHSGVHIPQPGGVFSSTGQSDDDVHDLKAWKLIDDAGMRGARRGRARR